jgi:hypothetical protein
MTKNFETLHEHLKQISTQDFLALGAQDIAYVRPVQAEGQRAYAIHAADGRSLAVVKSENQALATIRQNDLEAVMVH